MHGSKDTQSHTQSTTSGPIKWASILQAVDELGTPRVLVVGDVMLDRYTFGTVDRVSPEAPVAILRADRHDTRLGGAANVSLMAHALGAEVHCVSVLGDDFSGRQLQTLAAEAGVRLSAHVVPERATICKDRFVGQVAGHGLQQMLRVDHEPSTPLQEKDYHCLWQLIESALAGCHAVLVSDYGKGVCGPALLERLLQAARKHGIPVLVDPARNVDCQQYRGATLLKPNRAQAAHAVGRTSLAKRDALSVAQELVSRLELDAAVITLDQDGLLWYERKSQQHEYVPAVVREVCDVAGAGDVVLATLGVFLAAGCSLATASTLANLAAGCEVEHFGVVPVTRDQLRSAVLRRLSPAQKIVDLATAASLAERYRQEGKRIVFTNGCFDLLHVGHVLSLTAAAAEGDVLFVAVNSDRSVRKLKGPQRPIIRQYDRLALLAALECVDHVLLFDDDTPHALLHAIKPDVLVKGGTYRPEEVVGREVVESYGGVVRVTPTIEGISTTHIVQAISQKHAA
jgi:D-beta-D-heptose 7-phosphate kinase/D-beta-D-heptose 1-phosphate adenosyltransferase